MVPLGAALDFVLPKRIMAFPIDDPYSRCALMASEHVSIGRPSPDVVSEHAQPRLFQQTIGPDLIPIDRVPVLLERALDGSDVAEIPMGIDTVALIWDIARVGIINHSDIKHKTWTT